MTMNVILIQNGLIFYYYFQYNQSYDEKSNTNPAHHRHARSRLNRNQV